MAMNLAGSVYDELGAAINAATITVKNESGATVASTTTNPTGAWSVALLTATDAHTVEITLIGSQVRKIWGDIKVQVGEIVVIDKFELANGGVLVLPAGTLPGAALAAGSVPDAALATGINGAKLTAGTVPVTALVAPYMIRLASVDIGVDTATIDFANIPQGYRNLRLVVSGLLTVTSEVGILINESTSPSYNFQIADAAGATVSTMNGLSQTNGRIGVLSGAGSYGGIIDVLFANYALSSMYRKWTSTYGYASANTNGTVHRGSSFGFIIMTAPVDKITLKPNSGLFAGGLVAQLYGMQ